jgi:hypothetical protein
MKTQTQNVTNLKNSKVVSRIFKNVVGLSIVALFASCVPGGDNDMELLQAQPDGVALNNRFENNREDAMEAFILDASTGGIITGNQGTTVLFAPNSFGMSGVPVSGNVTVQLIEIYDKAAIVLSNKSTLGKRSNGDKEALKSAGEFFINAKQGSNELDLLNHAKVTSREINSADADFGMELFTAGAALNNDEDWVEAEEEVNVNEKDGTTGVMASYSFSLGDFGWSNLDRWYGFAGPKTQLFVDVPEGYNGDNCAVFLYYDNENTAIARMDTWNEEEEMFTEHYGLIPVGLEVHLIMVAEIDGQLHYAMQGTTIVDNHIELISSLTPITQSALEALINQLP